MKYTHYIIILLTIFVASYMLFCPEHNTALGTASYEELKTTAFPIFGTEPKWKKFTRIRELSDPSLGVILGDLESHMPNGHHYTDKNKLSWAHQVSHGINAKIRNDPSNLDGYNGFYVLQDRSFLLKEPEISIRDIALFVPSSLRGPSFDLYFNEQSSIWNDRPLYLIDEWVAFANGSDAGRELNINGWYYELLQAHNFNIYCMCLALVVQRDCSDYRDTDLKEFIMWNVERVFRLTYPSDKTQQEYYLKSGGAVANWNICPHMLSPDDSYNDIKIVENYVKKVCSYEDAQNFRKSAREYFGDAWFNKFYGSK